MFSGDAEQRNHAPASIRLIFIFQMADGVSVSSFIHLMCVVLCLVVVVDDDALLHTL